MFAVVRILGKAGMSKDIEDTLKMLRLSAAHNCVILPNTASYKGMLEKVKDVATYGEISKEVLAAMLKKRGRLVGDKRIDEAALKKITNHDNFEKFAEGLIAGKIKLKDFEEIYPVFRLTPPSKGFKSTKQHYPKGDLGYRGEKINELLERMV